MEVALPALQSSPVAPDVVARTAAKPAFAASLPKPSRAEEVARRIYPRRSRRRRLNRGNERRCHRRRRRFVFCNKGSVAIVTRLSLQKALLQPCKKTRYFFFATRPLLCFFATRPLLQTATTFFFLQRCLGRSDGHLQLHPMATEVVDVFMLSAGRRLASPSSSPHDFNRPHFLF